MNWKRSDLKQQAKNTLHNGYWKCVLVSLVLLFCGGGAGSTGFNFDSDSLGKTGGNSDDFSHYFSNIFNGYSAAALAGIVGIVFVIIIVVMILSVAISVFLLSPLEIGCRRFFIIARVDDANLSEMGYGFEHSYMNTVKTQFLRMLYTFLWSLLFVIPGIIKSYEYRMIPYLLAEDPELDTKDAFRLSKTMMDGEKWNAFVLDLSFIGWSILNVFTLGILGVFYVNPYYNNTCAELYSVLKQKVTESPQNSGVYTGDVTGQPQPYSQSYGQSYGQPYGQSYGQPYGQPASGTSAPGASAPGTSNPGTVGSSDAPFNTPYGQTPTSGNNGNPYPPQQ